jgi:RNA polymerase sigma-70 factor, ECF subfamily
LDLLVQSAGLPPTSSGLTGIDWLKWLLVHKLQAFGVYLVELEIVSSAKQMGWCEALYQQKAAELILYGRALGLSHGEAEDVLQETFLSLLRRTDAPSKAAHYCVRSYRNHALNYRRSLWRRLTRELESRRWFDTTVQETRTAEEAVRCMVTLSGEQREVVVLKIWHEHTFEEIGELLGISPNTAAGRYRYAMERLKRSMKGSEHETTERIGDAITRMGVTTPVSETTVTSFYTQPRTL